MSKYCSRLYRFHSFKLLPFQPQVKTLYVLNKITSQNTIFLVRNDKLFNSVTLCKSQVKTLLVMLKSLMISRLQLLCCHSGIVLHMKDALLLSRFLQKKIDYLCITFYNENNIVILEKLEVDVFGLYYVSFRAYESYATIFWILVKP